MSFLFNLPFPLLLGCTWPSWSTLWQSWNTGWHYWHKTYTRGLQLFFPWPWAVSSPLSSFWTLALTGISPLVYLTSGPSSHVPIYPSYPTLSQPLLPPGQGSPATGRAPSSLLPSASPTVVMAVQTGPARERGTGDWPGFRKWIGTKIGSLLNLAKNFAFLHWSVLLLLGLLYL